MAIELSNTEFRHIPKFGGELWFVKTSGSDANDGKSPDDAFETIGAAITASSSGDAITIMQGTYTETGLDVNKAGLELWFEIGAIIAPASGTALTVSGSYCRVTCPNGAVKVIPATDQTGVLITGNFVYLDEIRVLCFDTDEVTSADIGFDIVGDGCDLRRCRSSSPDVAAFKIQGDKNKLEDCCTGGGFDGTEMSSIGYWMTNSADKVRIKYCGSQGHSISGFQVDAGCTNGAIEGCYSGGGDGKWTDADDAFVWSHFNFDNKLYKRIDVDGNTGDVYQGNAADGTHYNLFKVTGTVKIFNIFAHVKETMPVIASVVNLELESDNNSVDITAAAGAPDLDGLVVGTVLERAGAAEDPLLLAEPDNACVVIENADYKAPSVPIILVKDNSADTYIQMVCAAAMNGGGTGKIHWHVEWAPITDDGFIEVV